MRCGSRTSAAKATVRGNSCSAPSSADSVSCDEQLGRELAAVDARRPGVARDVVRAGVGVLHVEDRVVVRALLQQLGVERRAGSRPGTAPASSGARPSRAISRRSSSSMMLPARLLRRAPLIDTSCPMSTSMSAFGSSPAAPRERLEAVHVAVVVGARAGRSCAGSPVALVQVVRRVGREVGVDAVGATDDAVAVIAEVGRAHPHRAVLVVDVPLLAQAVDRLVDEAAAAGIRRCRSSSRELHVEVHVELRRATR